MENRKYHGKLILFGEYSMIFDSDALLMPYYSAYGEWSSIINRPSEKGIESNRNLFKFYEYLTRNDKFRVLDLKRFEMELNAGLFFDSNIPNGYGVGSSGALVAAVYDRYKLVDIKDFRKLREILAEMENCFHGSSSGNDPLQCYYGKPFILQQQCREPNILDHDFISDNIHIFLLDTNIKSPTGPLVEHFKDLRKDQQYLDKFNNEYIPIVNRCISDLINKDDDKFFDDLGHLATLQNELLSHCIPEHFRKYFSNIINDNHFQIKLCGAGGGGYLLGFSKEIEKINEFWNTTEYKITWIK